MDQTKYHCACQEAQESLVIPRRQALRIIACATLMIFFIFVAGYFWGYQRAADLVCCQTEHDSFTDAIEYSLTKHFGREERCILPACEGDKEVKPEAADSVESMLAEAAQLAQTNQIDISAARLAPTVSVSSREPDTLPDKYQALVLGGSKNAVERFIRRMGDEGIVLNLKERVSTNKKGKRSVWYQAVTPFYKDRKELESRVALLKKRGKLNEVPRIVGG